MGFRLFSEPSYLSLMIWCKSNSNAHNLLLTPFQDMLDFESVLQKFLVHQIPTNKLHVACCIFHVVGLVYWKLERRKVRHQG